MVCCASTSKDTWREQSGYGESEGVEGSGAAEPLSSFLLNPHGSLQINSLEGMLICIFPVLKDNAF